MTLTPPSARQVRPEVTGDLVSGARAFDGMLEWLVLDGRSPDEVRRELLRAVGRLHADGGYLSVFWRGEPTAEHREAVEESWMNGEAGAAVKHKQYMARPGKPTMDADAPGKQEAAAAVLHKINATAAKYPGGRVPVPRDPHYLLEIWLEVLSDLQELRRLLDRVDGRKGVGG